MAEEYDITQFTMRVFFGTPIRLDANNASYRRCNLCHEVFNLGSTLITLYVDEKKVYLQYREGLTALPVHSQCFKKAKENE